MDLSHLIDSGNNESNTSSVISNHTPNNHSNAGSNISNSNSIKTNPSNSSMPTINLDDVVDDPIEQFLKDPNKVSRNKKEEENKIKKNLESKTTPQKPIPRTNVPEVEGKITAFVPFLKDNKVSFHSFSIQSKTTTNVDIEHITPPYVIESSNKKNKAQ